ncbi:MAG: hypothetical protein J6T01_04240, partial [Kiritimatiellae bacterium]|nr:hypothetical protein [Kiritimatiellia bacterium]
AAAFAAAAGFGAVFFAGRSPRPSETRVFPREYTLADTRSAAAVRELIATQRPDGGWRSDFLTRRNAAALKSCGDPAAVIAYKKAIRNLRSKGVL